MVIGTGNHNHHNRLYTIQLTTNGRCITWNRQNIKPTAVTADTYWQHQSNKHSNIKTDLLVEILSTINKNPTAYTIRQTTNINIKDGQYNEQMNNNKNQQQEAKEKEQCNKRTDISHKQGAGVLRDNKTTFQGGEVQRTKLGWVV